MYMKSHKKIFLREIKATTTTDERESNKLSCVTYFPKIRNETPPTRTTLLRPLTLQHWDKQRMSKLLLGNSIYKIAFATIKYMNVSTLCLVLNIYVYKFRCLLVWMQYEYYHHHRSLICDVLYRFFCTSTRTLQDNI